MMLIQKTNVFSRSVNKKILVGSFARSCPTKINQIPNYKKKGRNEHRNLPLSQHKGAFWKMCDTVQEGLDMRVFASAVHNINRLN